MERERRPGRRERRSARAAAPPTRPGSAQAAVLALQRTAGNQAVGRLLQRRPVPVPPSVKPPDTGDWYVDHRRPDRLIQRVSGPDEPVARYRVGTKEYTHHPQSDQYERVDALGRYFDPERWVEFELETDSRAFRVYYRNAQYGVCEYDPQTGRYMTYAIVTDFQPGDVVYGREDERKKYRLGHEDRARGEKTTADQFHKELGIDQGFSYRTRPDSRLSDDTREYKQYLGGIWGGRLLDEGADLTPEERVTQACQAMIYYKTNQQGYCVRFELVGIDPVDHPGFTVDELKYVIAHRDVLNIENVVFYIDGQRAARPPFRSPQGPMPPRPQPYMDRSGAIVEELETGEVVEIDGELFIRILSAERPDDVLGTYERAEPWLDSLFPPSRPQSPPPASPLPQATSQAAHWFFAEGGQDQFTGSSSTAIAAIDSLVSAHQVSLQDKLEILQLIASVRQDEVGQYAIAAGRRLS